MTEETIKEEIIERLSNLGDCSLCRSIGIYGYCENSSCNEFLKNFFPKIIEIKKTYSKIEP